MSLEPLDTFKPFSVPKPPPCPVSAWLLDTSSGQLSQHLQGQWKLLHDFRRSRSQGSQLSCWTLAGVFWLRSHLRFWWIWHSEWRSLSRPEPISNRTRVSWENKQIKRDVSFSKMLLWESQKIRVTMCTWELKMLWMSLLASCYTALQHGSERTECPTEM